MKLLLTSAGLTNESIANALLQLLRKPFYEANVAFIPTAANRERGDKGWFIEDLAKCNSFGFKQFDIVDISALSKEDWLPRLEEADVLYVEGGDTFYLMKWIKKSGLAEVLLELLKKRTYVGVSAGTIVICKSLDKSQSENLYDEKPGVDEDDNGLGYVDLLIRPHLNSPYFSKLTMGKMEDLAKEFPESFYAIDDNTAIKIDGEDMEIISEGVWEKFN